MKELSYSTVERKSRHIQRFNDDLRGKNYQERQRHSKKKAKEYSLTYLDKLQLWRQSV